MVREFLMADQRPPLQGPVRASHRPWKARKRQEGLDPAHDSGKLRHILVARLAVLISTGASLAPRVSLAHTASLEKVNT